MLKKDRIIQFLIAFGLVILLIGVDQLTKYLANTSEVLLNGGEIPFIKYILSFKLAYNKGAAFSILYGQKWLLVIISLVASIGGIYALYRFADFKKNWFLTIIIILVLSGAVGNLIDRVFYEEGVIDFLNFKFMEFPIFNFADTCLTVGAFLMIVEVLFFNKEKPKIKEEQVEGEQDA